MPVWFARAPANIALIKYMGKTDAALNRPANVSLSYTLPELFSIVELESSTKCADSWEALPHQDHDLIKLSEKGQAKFLQHLKRLKDHFDYQGHFIVRSTNNFAMATGLASSASSFAALTKAAIIALCELTQNPVPEITTQAQLSRLGSGSSCRSFFSPFALWEGDKVSEISALNQLQLIHHAIIVSADAKSVSSSEAHLRVLTSPDFAVRMNNAKARCDALLKALIHSEWPMAYLLIRDEFLEMHQLFKTASNPFNYMTEDSHSILAEIDQYWQTHHDGPLVTMDAGPNIHLLFRHDQIQLAQSFKERYRKNYDVL